MLRFNFWSCALSLMLLITIQNGAKAQKAEKTYAKAEKLADQGKIEKAEETLEKLLVDYPRYGAAWDLLVRIKLYHYDNAPDANIFGKSMSITVKGEDGEIKDASADSLAQTLMNLLGGASLKSLAYVEFLLTARKATLKSETAYMSAVYLRSYEVDLEIDTNINDSARYYFNQAENQFQRQNFNTAATLYAKALAHEPQFYKASLYLGDSYYMMRNFVEAAVKFKDAIEKFPMLIEPRKYLIDAYLENESYDEALEQAIASMAVYPELGMRGKLLAAASYNDLKPDFYWIPRGVFPNNYKSNVLIKNDPFADNLADDSPWKYYLEAKKELNKNVNDIGIITNNAENETMYAEVYAWEQMLSKSNHPSLDVARKMKEAGYLDCYVFVTCFHFDLLAQFQHFAAANQDRIKDYFTAYLVKDI